MNKIIALVGMAGSGKSLVADDLVKKGYSYLRFGQITLDILKERGLELSEENEKLIREGVRKEHGMAAYAILNIPKIDALLKKGDVVADGLYSWSEYKVLRDKYDDQLVVVAVYAPPKLRYQRLTNRKLEANDKQMRNRPFSKEQARSRDYAEIENIEKGGPIAMADFTLKNIGIVSELIQQLDVALRAIKDKD